MASTWSCPSVGQRPKLQKPMLRVVRVTTAVSVPIADASRFLLDQQLQHLFSHIQATYLRPKVRHTVKFQISTCSIFPTYIAINLREPARCQMSRTPNDFRAVIWSVKMLSILLGAINNTLTRKKPISWPLCCTGWLHSSQLDKEAD